LPDTQPPFDFATLRDLARAERLDLIAARQQVSALEQRLRLTQGTRWLGNSELGVGIERDADGSRRVGPHLSIELPVFQQGQGRVARDVAALEQARAAAQAIEIAIDAELQQQLHRVGIARAASEGFRTRLIPQREAIVDQMQQRTNQMLVDTFALLLAKQQEQSAYDGYVDAVQDYWRSRVALLRAAGTQLAAALPPSREDKP
jgi:cobalt-zinc-cadmium efflux system outer membrane protein